MKKTLVSTLLVSAMLLGGIGTSVVSAATDVVSEATSTGKVTFTTNTDPTDPVDPTDPEDPDPENPGTGNEGPLSLDVVPSLDFGTHDVTGNSATWSDVEIEPAAGAATTPFIQVTDKTGEMQGWHVNVTYDNFAKDTKTLASTTIHFDAGEVAKAYDAADASATAPVATAVDLTPGVAANIFHADESKGMGTWISVYNHKETDTTTDALASNGITTGQENSKITLSTIGDESATTYTANLNWTLAAGPTE